MKKLIVWTMALVFSLCVSLAFADEAKKEEPATPVEKAEKKEKKAKKKVTKAKKKVKKAKKELKKEEKKEEAPAAPMEKK